MTAAQQIAELQQRIQAMEFSLHEKEKELDAASFLGGDSALRLHAAIAERDALRAEVEVMLAMMELLARDIGYVSHAGKSPFFVSAKRVGALKLSDFGFSIGCSDTFEWACADAEAISIEQAPMVLKMLDEHGWPAVMQWIKDKRGDVDFIKQVQDAIDEDKALRAEVERLRADLEVAESRKSGVIHGLVEESKVLRGAEAMAQLGDGYGYGYGSGYGSGYGYGYGDGSGYGYGYGDGDGDGYGYGYGEGDGYGYGYGDGDGSGYGYGYGPGYGYGDGDGYGYGYGSDATPVDADAAKETNTP